MKIFSLLMGAVGQMQTDTIDHILVRNLGE